MKKRTIILCVIVTILVLLALNYKNIYRLYKLNQIKNDSINVLNGKFNNRTYFATIRDYERLHASNEELNHNNITSLIDIYINSVHNGMNIYILNNEKVIINKTLEYRNINELFDIEKGKGSWMKYYVIDYGVGDSFTSLDVRNYKDGTFKALLIEKLKSCLDYEENDGKIEWYINSVEDKVIELPYNCYIDYKAYHRENNHGFKKAIDVILLDKYFKLKKTNKAIVQYETSVGNYKLEIVDIDYIKFEDRDYYAIDISNVLTLGADTCAECTLSNHTLDRWKEEQRRETDRMVFSDWSD